MSGPGKRTGSNASTAPRADSPWPRSPTTAPGGHGEPLAIMLRPGNAGSNTAADHIEVTRLALAQLPRGQRRRVLIRTDSGGGTHELPGLADRARHGACTTRWA